MFIQEATADQWYGWSAIAYPTIESESSVIVTPGNVCTADQLVMSISLDDAD